MKILYYTTKWNPLSKKFYTPDNNGIPKVMDINTTIFDTPMDFLGLVMKFIELIEKPLKEIFGNNFKEQYAKEYNCTPEEISYETEKIYDDMIAHNVYAKQKLVARTYFILKD